MPVVKTNRSVRICADYKSTANAAVKTQRSPFTKIEDLFAPLEGGKGGSVPFLSPAAVGRGISIPGNHEHPQGIQNSHKLSLALALFHRTVETLLHCLPRLCKSRWHPGQSFPPCKSSSRICEKCSNRLKIEKCALFMPKVEYLGHRISLKLLQPTESKVRAVVNAP